MNSVSGNSALVTTVNGNVRKWQNLIAAIMITRHAIPEMIGCNILKFKSRIHLHTGTLMLVWWMACGRIAENKPRPNCAHHLIQCRPRNTECRIRLISLPLSCSGVVSREPMSSCRNASGVDIFIDSKALRSILESFCVLAQFHRLKQWHGYGVILLQEIDSGSWINHPILKEFYRFGWSGGDVCKRVAVTCRPHRSRWQCLVIPKSCS